MKQIPNIFTLLNLFFGCIAIVCVLQNGITIVYTNEGQIYTDIPEKTWLAPLFIGLAALVDFLDGFLARLLKQTSSLGKELDSLADIVSFGVAPGMILYQFLRLSFMNQENGADVSIEIAVDVSHRTLVFVIAFGADTAKDMGGAQRLRVMDQVMIGKGSHRNGFEAPGGLA